MAAFLAICFGAAALGALGTNSSLTTWYAGLEKPSWNPPNWIFGPVWTFLYASMAVAAWLVWRSVGFRGAKIPLTWFAVQLALNAAWSLLFFGLQSPALALVDVVLLLIAIVGCMLSFVRISPLAAVLLSPYLAWTSFAAVLNATLWQLNR